MFPEPGLPDRRDFVLTGITALTMNPALGKLPDVDITVRNGEIVAIDQARSNDLGGDFSRVEAPGLIALPGFVDTHWHLWNSLLRGTVADAEGHDYFTVKCALGPHHGLDDFYWAARFALAEAAAAGITTVHNWDHNVRSPQDAAVNIGDPRIASYGSGLFITCIYGAAAFAGYLFGRLVSTTGWTTAGLIQIAGFSLLGAVLAVLLRPTGFTSVLPRSLPSRTIPEKS